MNWFMDRKVGTKQILAFGSLLLLTVFLGLFALLRLSAIRATTVAMSDRRVPAIQSLSQLQASLMQYRVSEMSYVFLNDPEERELRTANMEAGMALATKAGADFEQFIDNPQEKKVYEAIKQDVEQCKAETLTILGYTGKNDTADATSEVLGSAAGIFSQLMSDTQAEIDLKVKGAAEAKAASAASYKRSAWWISATLFTATIMSLLLAITTTRSIARPVREVGEVVRRIAAGDITCEDLPVRGSDEMGELARNVNVMQQSLRGMIASVFTSAERIATASEEFSSTHRQIAAGSLEAHAARGTSAGAMDSRKAAEALVQMSTELHGLVSQFKVHINGHGVQVPIMPRPNGEAQAVV